MQLCVCAVCSVWHVSQRNAVKQLSVLHRAVLQTNSMKTGKLKLKPKPKLMPSATPSQFTITTPTNMSDKKRCRAETEADTEAGAGTGAGEGAAAAAVATPETKARCLVKITHVPTEGEAITQVFTLDWLFKRWLTEIGTILRNEHCDDSDSDSDDDGGEEGLRSFVGLLKSDSWKAAVASRWNTPVPLQIISVEECSIRIPKGYTTKGSRSVALDSLDDLRTALKTSVEADEEDLCHAFSDMVFSLKRSKDCELVYPLQGDTVVADILFVQAE